jgi:hypothetical protein
MADEAQGFDQALDGRTDADPAGETIFLRRE